MPEYPSEQLEELYEKLPKDLQEAVDSKKIGDEIYAICDRNGAQEQGPEVLRLVGYTLLGLLPPGELEQVFRQELGLKEVTARNIAREIIKAILYPLKDSLEALYQIVLEPPSPKEPLSYGPGKDPYRESID